MTEEMKPLHKEVNGKVVVFKMDKLSIDAILHWPPTGNSISVKPYGYESSEILSILESADFVGYDIETVSATSFCLTLFRTNRGAGIKIAQFLSNVPDNGTLDVVAMQEDFKKEIEEDKEGRPMVGEFNPSCPYG